MRAEDTRCTFVFERCPSSVVSLSSVRRYSISFTTSQIPLKNLMKLYSKVVLNVRLQAMLFRLLVNQHNLHDLCLICFPFLSSNIPTPPAYGVFISQLIRYARACSSYGCFILRATRLSNKLLEQGYVKECLKSSSRKFYGRYGDLIK